MNYPNVVLVLILWSACVSLSSSNSLTATCYNDHYLNIVLQSDVPISALSDIQYAINTKSNWPYSRTMVDCTNEKCSLSADGHKVEINYFLYHSFADFDSYNYAVNHKGHYTIPTQWDKSPKFIHCPSIRTTSATAAMLPLATSYQGNAITSVTTPVATTTTAKTSILSATCYHDHHLHIVYESKDVINALSEIQWAHNTESNWQMNKRMVNCEPSECTLSPDGHRLDIQLYLYHSFANFDTYAYAINHVNKHTIPANWENSPQIIKCPTMRTTTSTTGSITATTATTSSGPTTGVPTTPTSTTAVTTTVDPNRIYMIATCDRNRNFEITLHLGKARNNTLAQVQFAIEADNKWGNPPPMRDCRPGQLYCEKHDDTVVMRKKVESDNIRFAVNVKTYVVLPPCKQWNNHSYHMQCGDGKTLDGSKIDQICDFTINANTVLQTSKTTFITKTSTVPLTLQTTNHSGQHLMSTSMSPTAYNANHSSTTKNNTTQYIGMPLVYRNPYKVWMNASCDPNRNFEIALHLGTANVTKLDEIALAIDGFYDWGDPYTLNVCNQAGVTCSFHGDVVVIKTKVKTSFNKFALHIGKYNMTFPLCDDWKMYPYTIICNGQSLQSKIRGSPTEMYRCLGKTSTTLSSMQPTSIGVTGMTSLSATSSTGETLIYRNPYKMWMNTSCDNNKNLQVTLHLGSANVSSLDEIQYAVEGFYNWGNPPIMHSCNATGAGCKLLGDTVSIKTKVADSFNKLAVHISKYNITFPLCENWKMYPYTIECNGNALDSRIRGPATKLYSCIPNLQSTIHVTHLSTSAATSIPIVSTSSNMKSTATNYNTTSQNTTTNMNPNTLFVTLPPTWTVNQANLNITYPIRNTTSSSNITLAPHTLTTAAHNRNTTSLSNATLAHQTLTTAAHHNITTIGSLNLTTRPLIFNVTTPQSSAAVISSKTSITLDPTAKTPQNITKTAPSNVTLNTLNVTASTPQNNTKVVLTNVTFTSLGPTTTASQNITRFAPLNVTLNQLNFTVSATQSKVSSNSTSKPLSPTSATLQNITTVVPSSINLKPLNVTASTIQSNIPFVPLNATSLATNYNAFSSKATAIPLNFTVSTLKSNTPFIASNTASVTPISTASTPHRNKTIPPSTKSKLPQYSSTTIPQSITTTALSNITSIHQNRTATTSQSNLNVAASKVTILLHNISATTPQAKATVIQSTTQNVTAATSASTTSATNSHIKDNSTTDASTAKITVLPNNTNLPSYNSSVRFTTRSIPGIHKNSTQALTSKFNRTIKPYSVSTTTPTIVTYNGSASTSNLNKKTTVIISNSSGPSSILPTSQILSTSSIYVPSIDNTSLANHASRMTSKNTPLSATLTTINPTTPVVTSKFTKITPPPQFAHSVIKSPITTTATAGCPNFPSNCPAGCATYDNNFCPICDYNICGASSPTANSNGCPQIICALNCGNPPQLKKDKNGCDRCECLNIG